MFEASDGKTLPITHAHPCTDTIKCHRRRSFSTSLAVTFTKSLGRRGHAALWVGGGAATLLVAILIANVTTREEIRFVVFQKREGERRPVIPS